MIENILSKPLDTLTTTFREIALLTESKTFDDYRASRMLRRATERECDLIGSALFQLLPQFSTHKELVAHARLASDFRDYLIHRYDEVDDAKVWEMATITVPVMKQQIDAWLAELPA